MKLNPVKFITWVGHTAVLGGFLLLNFKRCRKRIVLLRVDRGSFKCTLLRINKVVRLRRWCAERTVTWSLVCGREGTDPSLAPSHARPSHTRLQHTLPHSTTLWHTQVWNFSKTCRILHFLESKQNKISLGDHLKTNWQSRPHWDVLGAWSQIGGWLVTLLLVCCPTRWNL